jgi:S-adenosylmethionine hydrolase
MSIITLTTDFGLEDYYVGAVKGAILSLAPQALIVDISHQIKINDVLNAAYIVKNAYHNFPKESIHIIGVSSNSSPEMPYTVAYANGHYFISTDNGIFSLLFDSLPEKIVSLNTGGNSFIFPTRDVFAKAACFLVNGGKIEDMGQLRTSILQKSLLSAAAIGDIIRGSVIHVDKNGNAITNISKNLFDTYAKNKKIEIAISASINIEKISQSYTDEPEGEILALFNTAGFLEIAHRNGSALVYLGLDIGKAITIHLL